MIDLGITTYLFIIISFSLLILSVVRILIAVALTVTSIFIYGNVRDVSFLPLINETLFLGMNEMAMFILGILASFKNNIRLMYTFELLIVLLMLAKGLSLHESVKNKDVINEDLQLSLEDMMNDFRAEQKSSSVASNVIAIQTFFRCCGYESKYFYAKVEYDQSCCPENVEKCRLHDAISEGCKKYVHVPDILFNIHYYSMFPVFEAILFLIGAVLISYIKKSSRITFN